MHDERVTKSVIEREARKLRIKYKLVKIFHLMFFITPIYFLQVSDISGCGYHLATMLGLLPAQVINVYLGSTLRSMHDVLHESHVTGYIVFAFQVIFCFLRTKKQILGVCLIYKYLF